MGFAASVVVFWPLNPPGASIPSQSEFRKEIKQGRDASERQGVASFVCLAGAEVEGSAKAVDVPSLRIASRFACVRGRVGNESTFLSTVSPPPFYRLPDKSLHRLPDKSSPGTKAFADAVIFLPIECIAAAPPSDAGADAGGAAPVDVDIAAFFTSALSSSSSPKSMPLESTTSDTVSPTIASVTTSGRLINPLDPDVLIA